MKHPIYSVKAFEQTGTYSLRIRFNDGLVRTIDFEPILNGELFGPLKAPSVFARVVIDQEIHTLVWPSGADFDPAVLHDWPEHEAAYIKAASERWSHPTALA